MNEQVKKALNEGTQARVATFKEIVDNLREITDDMDFLFKQMKEHKGDLKILDSFRINTINRIKHITDELVDLEEGISANNSFIAGFMGKRSQDLSNLQKAITDNQRAEAAKIQKISEKMTKYTKRNSKL